MGDVASAKEVQRLVCQFQKTGADETYHVIRGKFEGFINKQAAEIGGIFNWVASRSDVYEKLDELFTDAILMYKVNKAPFVLFATTYVKSRAQNYFRERLRETLGKRTLSEEITEEDIVHISDSVTDVRKQIVLFNAARRCKFTTRQAMVAGALLMGARLVVYRRM